VPESRQKGRRARWIDGGRRRWPLRLEGNGEEARDLNNTRPWEAHGRLVELLEQLAGGERKRGGELTAAAAMAAVRLGVARGGGTSGFYRWLGVSVGDGG
jgi:hypothetical protein